MVAASSSGDRSSTAIVSISESFCSNQPTLRFTLTGLVDPGASEPTTMLNTCPTSQEAPFDSQLENASKTDELTAWTAAPPADCAMHAAGLSTHSGLRP